jgi:outer membrane lipoprotein carrier protein
MPWSLLAFVSILAAFLSTALNVDSARRALESRYQHARTLKAIFFERYSDGSGGESSESGTVSFSRPSRMRWDYESPEKKLFLVDGQNVWFYVPSAQTASHAKLKESSDWRTPLALLTGKADLAKLCSQIDLVPPAPTSSSATAQNRQLNPAIPLDPSDAILRCTPRGESSSGETAVFLESNPQGDLMRLIIREPGNAETEFRFGNWEQNVPIPESEFHFQPPVGISIVNEESLQGELH